MGILTDGDRRARDETIGANRVRPGKSDQLPPFSLFGIETGAQVGYGLPLAASSAQPANLPKHCRD